VPDTKFPFRRNQLIGRVKVDELTSCGGENNSTRLHESPTALSVAEALVRSSAIAWSHFQLSHGGEREPRRSGTFWRAIRDPCFAHLQHHDG